MLQKISTNQLASGRLTEVFELQREAYLADPIPSLAQRTEWLNALEQLVVTHESALISALSEDFGHRSRHESAMLDIVSTLGCVRHLRKHLAQWSKPRKMPTPLALQPARSYVIPQPLGVVGIITPWNFPVYLSLAAIATALAAGNRCMLKPSELTPRTSALMAELLESTFGEQVVAVIQGDASVAQAFSSMPFDHLMFTGSTAVGRMVARAAAENLVPLTLELGGKSPLILAPSGDLKQAATCAAHGKMINAGQICVSPDYALVPQERLAEFVEAVRASCSAQYPSVLNNPDVSCVITPRHIARLRDMVEDARAKGAEIVQINPAQETFDEQSTKFPLTLVLNPTPDMRVMQEEIFGSILPVLTYSSLASAVAHVQRGERPLALYMFLSAPEEKEMLLTQTISGGVTINDAMWHVLNDNLPFGGVGASGMGAYHGQTGFDNLSKLKPVLEQSKVNAVPLLRAPYGTAFETVLGLLKKIV